MKQFSSSPLLFIFLLLSFAIFTFSSSSEVATKFKNYHELGLPKSISGPESLTFDCHGNGPYTGVADGRIFKWQANQNQWVEFAVNSPHRNRTICDGSTDPNKEPICGRPLGLKFETKTCNLYIADAYFGLLMVGPNGGVPKTIPISAADALPLKYLNGIDVDDQTGILYLSQSSTVYERREVQSMIRNGDKTGRLLTYDPSSKKVQVLLEGLQDANGVALSKDASFLLIIESIPKTIHKFWLKGSKAYTSEFFAQFERAPDNIKRNKNGDFWVGLYSNRTSYEVASDASLQKQAQVSWKKKKEEGDPVGVKFDEKGEITGVLDGRGGRELDSVSEVEERDGKLWIGSLVKPYVAVLEIGTGIKDQYYSST